jgi:hypothetical protein
VPADLAHVNASATEGVILSNRTLAQMMNKTKPNGYLAQCSAGHSEDTVEPLRGDGSATAQPMQPARRGGLEGFKDRPGRSIHPADPVGA